MITGQLNKNREQDNWIGLDWVESSRVRLDYDERRELLRDKRLLYWIVSKSFKFSNWN